MSLNPQNCHTTLKCAVNYLQAHTAQQKCSYLKVQLQTINTFMSICSDTAVYKHTGRVAGNFSSLAFCQMGKACLPQCLLKEKLAKCRQGASD